MGGAPRVVGAGECAGVLVGAMGETPSADYDAHLLPEWADVCAATVRAALALRALDVALAAYADARVIPPGATDA